MELQEQKELTRKNLQRVLDELPKLAEQMPEIKRDFDMGVYGVYNNLEKENLGQCGTYGCLLGNAARIFEAEFTDDLFSNFSGRFIYRKFAKKFFPYLYFNEHNMFGIDHQKKGWNYLFCEDWAGTKFNDLNSALQRIENLLANDLECDEFRFETNQIIN